jgi:hypothetical protein
MLYTDHVTPLYPQKLALTSPTALPGKFTCGLKNTEFVFVLYSLTRWATASGLVVRVSGC